MSLNLSDSEQINAFNRNRNILLIPHAVLKIFIFQLVTAITHNSKRKPDRNNIYEALALFSGLLPFIVKKAEIRKKNSGVQIIYIILQIGHSDHS